MGTIHLFAYLVAISGDATSSKILFIQSPRESLAYQFACCIWRSVAHEQGKWRANVHPFICKSKFPGFDRVISFRFDAVNEF